MKKIGSVLLCLALICSFAVPTVFAEREIKVFAREKEILFDVPPRMMQDRVMVPISQMFETLGRSVYWDEADMAVYIHEPTSAQAAANFDISYIINLL